MRLDKYLKVTRLIKRRTVANEACDAGRVQINGRPAKASAEVKVGDKITIGFGNKDVSVEVLGVPSVQSGADTNIEQILALEPRCCSWAPLLPRGLGLSPPPTSWLTGPLRGPSWPFCFWFPSNK